MSGDEHRDSYVGGGSFLDDFFGCEHQFDLAVWGRFWHNICIDLHVHIGENSSDRRKQDSAVSWRLLEGCRRMGVIHANRWPFARIVRSRMFKTVEKISDPGFIVFFIIIRPAEPEVCLTVCSESAP